MRICKHYYIFAVYDNNKANLTTMKKINTTTRIIILKSDEIKNQKISTKSHREIWADSEQKCWSQDDDFNTDIIKGKSIRIYGQRYGEKFDKTFVIGDEVEESSYNYVYLGDIVGISESSVLISKKHYTANTRMNLRQFIFKNYDLDLEKIAARNLETSYTI